MLNDYRDEARMFLDSVAPAAGIEDVVDLLREELQILDAAVKSASSGGVEHQIYDLLFLVMEMAAVAEADLDAEWLRGLERKRAKYLISAPRREL